MGLAFGEVRAVDISSIYRGNGAQVRAETDQETVDQYARRMQAGDKFPPVSLVDTGDGEQPHWSADGLHRIEAADSIGRKQIDAFVAKGAARDAQIHGATKANRTNAKQLTRADKQRAAFILLRDPEYSQLTNTDLEPVLDLARQTIAKYRDEAGAQPTIDAPEALRPGVSYIMSYDDGKFGCQVVYGWHDDSQYYAPEASLSERKGYWLIADETWTEGVQFKGDFRGSFFSVWHYTVRPEDNLGDCFNLPHWRLIKVLELPHSKAPAKGFPPADWDSSKKYHTYRAHLDMRCHVESMTEGERRAFLRSIPPKSRKLYQRLLADRRLDRGVEIESEKWNEWRDRQVASDGQPIATA